MMFGRNFIIFLICLCFYNPASLISAAASQIDPNGRLLDKLFANYNPLAYPKQLGSNAPLNVEFGASLIRINKLDVENEILEAAFWFNVGWKDFRLTWYPSSFDGISTVRIPSESVWKPDLYIYNGIEDKQAATTLDSNVPVVIYSDGRMLFVTPIVTKTTCAIDKSSDLQTCKLKIGSWTYDGNLLNITLDSNKLDTSTLMDNKNWILEKAEIVRNEMKYDCCEEQYIDATITLNLRRRRPESEK